MCIRDRIYWEKHTKEAEAMSRADRIFLQNCKDILQNGVWDTDGPVRPRWEDGAPAHTIKLFGIVNRYHLQEEFPIQTIRKINFKAALDEIFWIWQKKSNTIDVYKRQPWCCLHPWEQQPISPALP